MSQGDSAAVMSEKPKKDGSRTGGGGPTPPSGNGGRGSPSGRPSRGGGGFFEQYKPEQGKWTRLGTFVGLMALIAWGAQFIYEQLQVYEGSEGWRLLVTAGIPLAFLVVVGSVAWWTAYSSNKSGDFMIATEGEMKKVSWSTRREIIGSTKVVILFTFLMAAVLFMIDLLFQFLFSAIGVLKT